MTNQLKISNSYLSMNPDYIVEHELIGNEVRQVVKVAEMPTTGIVSSAASSPTFATIGTSSATALALNANRKGAVFVNDSANIIYLSLNGAAVVGRGIRLNPNGGSFTMTPMTFTTAAITAIATGASSNLCVQEFT